MSASCNRAPASASTLEDVVLSYVVGGHTLVVEPAFRVDVTSGGHVEFQGRRNCAVPGHWSYRIPEHEFPDLVRAFDDAHFFDIPRLGRVVMDAGAVTIAFRDARRVHEVVDTGREAPALALLEARLRRAARVDRLLEPSLALYRELVDAGWDVNSRGDDHQNAVETAVGAGDLEAVRFLVEHGATVSGEALERAARSGDVRILRLLLAVTATDMGSADAGEYLVSARRNTEMVRFLLDRGIDVNARDRSGDRTPLIAAVSDGLLETTRLLLSRGADVSATDRRGRAALWYAAQQSNTIFITLLAQHGAHVNAQDADGGTALMNAVSGCQYWNVKALLAIDADPRITDKRGRTAQPSGSVPGDPNCNISLDLVDAARKARAPR